MAVGDTIYKFSGTITNTNSWTLQPPANETWVITTVVGGGADSSVYLYDGSAAYFLWDLPAAADQPTPCRIFINNAHYLRIYNGSGSDKTFAVVGQIIGDAGGFMEGILGVAIGATDPYGVDAVRPPAGEEWIITALNRDTWTMTDGSTATTDTPLGVSQTHGASNQLAIWVTNTNYIYHDTEAKGYSGIIAKKSS